LVKLITFDAAGTLIRVKRSLLEVLGSCTREPVSDEELATFHALYVGRLAEFHKVNEVRNVAAGRAFWVQLAWDWLALIDRDPSEAACLQERVEEVSFGRDSAMFSLYPDVIPSLLGLRDRGVKLAVVSNWDYSLHTLLENFGVRELFDCDLASLEEGWEKPDARLFQQALSLCGVSPSEAVHVGDDLVDDFEGAVSAGMRAVLIDRTGNNPDAIRSLPELNEVIDWGV
jgi:REG-2-like HAD superfamily hydrolase